MHHPTAIISPQAKIHPSVTIGPFSIIDADVTIGENSRIDPHVRIIGKTIIGKNNFIGYGSQIGGLPQDLGFDPTTDSGTILGDNNNIRENVTIHRSTGAGKNTTLGDNNFLMVNAHLAHDVTLGNNNVLANNCMLAGHITVGNSVFLGGGAGFHQFINIGDLSITQGNASISKDIPPYCLAHGNNHLTGLNTIGLRRAGHNAERRLELKKLYNHLFKSKLLFTESLASATQTFTDELALKLIHSCQNPSRKGVINR